MKKITQLITILFCIFIGAVSMADDNLSAGKQNVLVLDDEAESSGDILKTVDITSKEKTLGGNDEFRIVDGKVSVLKPLVYKLTKPKETPLGQDKNSHFYLVKFRFTLHPPETKRRYEGMTFKVKLSSPNVTTLQLIPDKVETEADVNKDFDIGFSIGIPGTESSIGANTKETVNFKKLVPSIVAYNNNDAEFYWKYSKAPGADTVEPGIKTVAAVIQVPDAIHSLGATINWEVKLNRSFLGDWRDVPNVTVEPITVNIPMS
jgi:hypothetical protein